MTRQTRTGPRSLLQQLRERETRHNSQRTRSPRVMDKELESQAKMRTRYMGQGPDQDSKVRLVSGKVALTDRRGLQSGVGTDDWRI